MLAKRIKSETRIGPSPRHQYDPPRPRTRQTNCLTPPETCMRPARFRTIHLADCRVIDAVARSGVRRSSRSKLSVDRSGTKEPPVDYREDRPYFPPSPRAWPVILGAAAGPSWLRPYFFAQSRDIFFNPKNADGRDSARPSCISTIKALIFTRWPAARAAALCVRRTGPGSQPRKPRKAGKVWRSGTPAPAACRSGTARDRP